jgi:predicted PurR-regulated permease PerM
MTRRFSVGILLVLVAFLSYLAYLIFRPFFLSLAWAAVFAVVFYPVYAFILRRLRRPALASLATVVVVLAVITGPLLYLSYLLVGELTDLAGSGLTVEGMKAAYQSSFIHELANKVLPTFHLDEHQAIAYVVDTLSNLSKQILHYAPVGIGNLVGAVVTFGIMAFVLFFLLKDGGTYVEAILDLLPFSERHKERLSGQTKDVIVSTIYGGVAVAVAQGIVGALGYLSVGMSSPVLWGLATAVTSFIPFVGSHVVWVPMGLYLLATGHVAKALILTAFGVLGIGIVDNVVRPLFIRGRAKMSFLVTFLSVLGGIEAFGLIGIIVGPLVIALYISLIAILKDTDESETSVVATPEPPSGEPGPGV